MITNKKLIHDVTCTYDGGKFILTDLPFPLPELFTVRFTTPEAFLNGNVIVVNNQEFPLRTPAGIAATSAFFRAGTIFHCDIDFNKGFAYAWYNTASTAHNNMTSRDAAACHPSSAITHGIETVEGALNVLEARTDSIIAGGNDLADRVDDLEQAVMDIDYPVKSVNGKTGVVNVDLPDFPLAQAALDAKAGHASSFIDCDCVQGGGVIELTPTGPVLNHLSRFITVRFQAANDYAQGDVVRFAGITYSVLDYEGNGLENGAFIANALVELNLVENNAFFKGGAGGCAGPGNGWNVYVGSMVPGSKGIQVADASIPEQIYVTQAIRHNGMPFGNVKKVEIRALSTFLLLDNGEVWSCGYNQNARLGRDVESGSPTHVNWGRIPIGGVADISVGGNHALFLLENGEVWSCGYNYFGALGRVVDSPDNMSNLGRITSLPPARSIHAGGNFSYFVTQNGVIYNCGANSYGNLGRSVSTATATRSNLGILTGMSNVLKIACGLYHVLFLTNDNVVWSCGQNIYGELGRRVETGTETRTNLGIMTSMKADDIYAGFRTSFFKAGTSAIWSCGSNYRGELGRNVASGSETSMNLGQMGLANVDSVFPGQLFTYFRLSDGTIMNCGDNTYGQLGRAVSNGYDLFTNLGLLENPPSTTMAALGQSDVHLLAANGQIWNAGYNNKGQLGRIVESGSNTMVNLGLMHYPNSENLYANGSLVIETGGNNSAQQATLIFDGYHTVEAPINAVYQIESNQLIPKTYTILG